MSTVPDWLKGLWKRLSIESADGHDTQTQVFYLQTSACFGDLRLPITRPELKQSSFAALTQAERVALAQQQGFAGIARFEQGHCKWMRYIDYQPQQAAQDIGLLYWQDDILIEDGVEQVYREKWQKLDDGGGDYTALVLPVDSADPDVSWQAGLVITGDHFIYSQNRLVALPAVDQLADCLTDTMPLKQQQAYLDCEISYGLCQSGQLPWEIQHSTVPWQEGKALWATTDWVVDLEHRRALQTLHQDNSSEIREWQIREWGTGKAFISRGKGSEAATAIPNSKPLG